MGMAVVRRLSSWPIRELAVKVNMLDAELKPLARRLPGSVRKWKSPSKELT
jgi:hypothetical protein